MKQVFEQYASSIIAAMIASVLFVMLFDYHPFEKKSFGQVLGHVLEYSIDENYMHGNDAFKKYMNDVPPVIMQKDAYAVKKNKRVLLSDCYEAKSDEGKSLPVFLKKAWSLDGEEIQVGLSSDGKSICISEAGVYWVQLYAIDDRQKETSVIVKLLVNER